MFCVSSWCLCTDYRMPSFEPAPRPSLFRGSASLFGITWKVSVAIFVVRAGLFVCVLVSSETHGITDQTRRLCPRSVFLFWVFFGGWGFGVFGDPLHYRPEKKTVPRFYVLFCVFFCFWGGWGDLGSLGWTTEGSTGCMH